MIDFTIDAGHGGSDSGAIGVTGVREKDITLKLALKVGKILTSKGVSVNYTRTDDRNVELSQRAAIANKAKARFFLSIHINTADTPTAHGTETYAFSSGGQGEKLAAAIQKNLVAAIGLTNRGVKFANFAVLRETSMPAALTEVSFICNPKEEAMLKDESFLDKAATGIAKGMIEILGRKWEDTQNPKPTNEPLYRVRKTWEDASSQVGAYKVLDNAKAECDKYKGYGVFDEKGKKVYPPSSTEKPTTPLPPTKDNGTRIMGTTQATVAQMVSFALKGNKEPQLPHCTIKELAEIFITEAKIEGVRADVAWAQALKETGYFKYGGIVLPEQNNYSGIGALNNNSEGQAATFKTPTLGVRAQIQHLKAYASKEALAGECVDPRFGLVTRGSAEYVEWLGAADNPNGKGWAYPGKGYGASIMSLLNGMLKEETESNVPQWQIDALSKLVELGIITDEAFWSNKMEDKITVGEVIGLLGKVTK